MVHRSATPVASGEIGLILAEIISDERISGGIISGKLISGKIISEEIIFSKIISEFVVASRAVQHSTMRLRTVPLSQRWDIELFEGQARKRSIRQSESPRRG